MTTTAFGSADKSSVHDAGRRSAAPAHGSGTEHSVWQPRSEVAVRIVGAGGYVPPHAITASDMARAIPGWTAEQIVAKTGIVERRFLWQLDVERGCSVPKSQFERQEPASGADMGEAALASALKMSGLSAADLDMLVVVTCTPDQPRFSHDAMLMQRRLGIRKSAPCFVVDSGCGGALYLLDMVARMPDPGRGHLLRFQGRAPGLRQGAGAGDPRAPQRRQLRVPRARRHGLPRPRGRRARAGVLAAHEHRRANRRCRHRLDRVGARGDIPALSGKLATLG